MISAAIAKMETKDSLVRIFSKGIYKEYLDKLEEKIKEAINMGEYHLRDVKPQDFTALDLIILKNYLHTIHCFKVEISGSIIDISWE